MKYDSNIELLASLVLAEKSYDYWLNESKNNKEQVSSKITIARQALRKMHEIISETLKKHI